MSTYYKPIVMSGQNSTEVSVGARQAILLFLLLRPVLGTSSGGSSRHSDRMPWGRLIWVVSVFEKLPIWEWRLSILGCFLPMESLVLSAADSGLSVGFEGLGIGHPK